MELVLERPAKASFPRAVIDKIRYVNFFFKSGRAQRCEAGLIPEGFTPPPPKQTKKSARTPALEKIF